MKTFELSIPKPCAENWEAMTPEDKGRFCVSCQKTVIDFSGMSDVQIAQFFKKPTGSVCGRFDESQLNRVVEVPRKRLPWIKYFFTIALPAFLFSKKVAAQGEVKRSPLLVGKVAVCTPEPKKSNALKPLPLKPLPLLTVNGTVNDENGLPVPNASVVFRYTQRGVSANEKGEFFIRQEKETDRELVVSAVGFQSKVIPIGEAENVILNLLPMITGEVIVVNTVKKKKSSAVPPPKQKADTASPPFLIYPNPVSSNSSFTLEAKELESGAYSMQLFNIAGEVVQTKELAIEKKARQSVALGGAAAGTYVIRLTAKGKGGKAYSEVILIR